MTSPSFMREHHDRPVTKLTSLTLALAFLLLGCPRHGGGAKNNSSGTQTETISPAVAQPGPAGTEPMTQTVNVDDSRSEEDGGTSRAPKKPATKPAAKPAAKKGR